MKRGQISVEYLIIAGFIVFLVITIIGFAFFYTSGTSDAIKINQVSNFANKITSNAEAVFYAGEPSRVTITAYLPDGVQNIAIQENNLFVIDVQTTSGVSKIGFKSDVPLTIAASPNDLKKDAGVKSIQIIAQSGNVLIYQN